MTDRDSLMWAIRDNPDDDTPRLLYADWLEDHARGAADRARARFIRLQCEAERLPDADPRRAALRLEAAGLQAEHGRDWLAVLDALGLTEPEELTFSRGFLADLTILTDYYDAAAMLGQFLAHEHADSVSLGGSPAGVAAAAGHPGMGFASTVVLNGKLTEEGDLTGAYEPGAGDAALEALAAVPRRTPLRALLTTRFGLTDAAAPALTTAPAFRHLRRLLLDGAWLTADGLVRFRGAVFAPTLRSLTVEQLPWTWGPADRGPDVAAAFADGGYDALESLALGGYPLGDAGLAVLSGSRLARRLVAFQLDGDRHLLGPGVAALFDRTRWPALGALRLMPVAAPAEELGRWMGGDGLATLQALRLFLANGTADPAARLAANPHASRLKVLEFTGRGLGDGAVRALIASPHLTALRRLGLCGPGIADATLRALANPATLPGLREVEIKYLDPVVASTRAALRRRFGSGLALHLTGE